MKHPIPYVRPSITEREVALATDAARNGWGPNCYDYIYRFEDLFAEHLEIDHVIATSSCTGALQMGLHAIGIGPGDEVILAESNWVATVSPVVHLGAKPVFVDILEDTWCIDPAAAERAITAKTKAIIATHLYGNLADMARLRQICFKHGLHLVEDAAEALGGKIGSTRAGNFGDFATFSFHGSKTITTGEGGMFVTANADLYETVLTLSNHGRARNQTKQFFADAVGYKFRMSNIEAALGCAQMERIDNLCQRKRDILASYQSFADKCNGISANPNQSGCTSAAWMPTYVFDRDLGITREKLLAAFRAEQIDARVFFYPLSSLPMFDARQQNEVAWDICNRAINLPSYHDMTDDDIARVTDVIGELLRQKN